MPVAACYHCGLNGLVGEGRYFGTGTTRDFYCSNCWSICSQCNGDIPADEIYSLPTNSMTLHFCENCWDDLPVCGNCGERFFTHDVNGRFVNCPNCRESNEENDRNSINYYSYKPSPEYKSSTKDILSSRRFISYIPVQSNRRARSYHDRRMFSGIDNILHFGVEVEMEVKGNYNCYSVAKDLINSTEGLFYCKEDGSLSSNGFEAVSHPFTLEWAKSNPEILNKLFACQTRARSYSTRNCGMHVHMTRSAFTALHLFKFVKFFYDNPRFVFFVSGRHDMHELNKYASISRHQIESGGRSLAGLCNGHNEPSYRNVCINFFPTATIECRIFKGTLSRTRFFANIEFLHGLFEYTKERSASGISLLGFLNYMRNNKKMYRNFYTKYKPFSGKLLKSVLDTTVELERIF